VYLLCDEQIFSDSPNSNKGVVNTGFLVKGSTADVVEKFGSHAVGAGVGEPGAYVGLGVLAKGTRAVNWTDCLIALKLSIRAIRFGGE
jgi:hypothetical protein